MQTIIEWFQYILLGLIQGITEILPISSSGHLVLFQNLFGLEQSGITFEMFTNMASFIALFIYFRKDVWVLIEGFVLFIWTKKIEYKPTFLYVINLLIAIIPIGIMGYLFKDQMGAFKTLLSVGVAWLLTGILLYLIPKMALKNVLSTQVTIKKALGIGLFQMFAILPGISRSGSTILGGLSLKVNLQDVLKFSFLNYLIISVPTSLLSIIDVIHAGESIDLVGYSLAFIASFISTYVVAMLVMKKLQIKHLKYFSFYCLAIGIVAILLYII